MKVFKKYLLLPWYKHAIQAIGVIAVIYIFYPIISSSLNSAPTQHIETKIQPGSVIDVANITDSRELAEELLIWEDIDKKILIEQLVGVKEGHLFEPTNGDLNYGFTQSAYWAKFKVTNTSAIRRTIILRQDYPLIDYLDFWQVSQQNIIKHIKTGDREVFDTRELKHKEFWFEISLDSGESHSIFLRFQTQGALNIGLSLNDTNALNTHMASEHLALGAYYGGVLVLAIYNMFLFFAAKVRAFTHYLWYLISYGLYMSTHNGYAFQYLWPDNPWLANQSLLLLLSLSLYWGMKFSQEIVASSIYSPRLDKAGGWLQILAVLFFIGSFVLPYNLMILALSILTVIVCVVILAMGITSLLARYKPALFFMIAWSTLLISVLVYMLKTFGLLPHNPLTQNAFQIGSLIEMTLLSIALSHHFSELKMRSYTDALTVLYNRRHFDDKLNEEFSHAKRYHKSLSLLIIDIDRFKDFNDAYGHAEGDKVIQFVAKILKKYARKPLIPCRYGGEEFAVILPGTIKDSAMVLAERLRERVAAESAEEQAITISIGVASISEKLSTGEVLRSPQELFEAADEALYQAKKNGRNRVEDYSTLITQVELIRRS